MRLGKLEEINDLRSVWATEAGHFTPWLAKDENIAELGDALGLDITVEEIESNVGDFRVDIFASETNNGRKIVIENQLEDTNHDHLGKLITYATGKSANIIVWLVKQAKPEHSAAINWLNKYTTEEIGFFLCEIKLYKIGESDPAVKFEVIEKPNNWSKGVQKMANAKPIEQQRHEYWTAFKNYATNNTDFNKQFKVRNPSTDHWMNFSIKTSSCHISVSQIAKRNAISVEVYIPDNKELYQHFLKHKDEIQQKTGVEYEWKELPEKKASRIIIEEPFDLRNQGEWPKQFDWIISQMIKMKSAFTLFFPRS